MGRRGSKRSTRSTMHRGRNGPCRRASSKRANEACGPRAEVDDHCRYQVLWTASPATGSMQHARADRGGCLGYGGIGQSRRGCCLPHRSFSGLGANACLRTGDQRGDQRGRPGEPNPNKATSMKSRCSAAAGHPCHVHNGHVTLRAEKETRACPLIQMSDAHRSERKLDGLGVLRAGS